MFILLSEASTRSRAPQRRLKPSARRALIDKAATKVFAEHGFEAATMQQIAQAAGVVASVLYDHYPSKEVLYIKLLEQHGQKLIEQTIRSPGELDPREALRGQVDDFFEMIEADPFVWRMLLRDPPGEPKTAAVHARIHAKAAAAMAAVLEGEAAAGGAEALAMAAEMVKASLAGLANWWWEHRNVRRAEVVEVATTLIWGGLGGIDQRRDRDE